MRKVLLHIISILLVFVSFGQNSVKAIAKPKPDSILLRWAPVNKETWKLGNQHGYMIERVTLVENKIRIAKPKREMLTATPIRPLPLGEWEPIAKNNKYGAITAQALYGEDFNGNAKSGASSSWTQMYQKSNEEDMRFGFALFSADMDVSTAKASGLRFVDKKVKKGDKYLYKIYIATPSPPSAETPRQGRGIDTALVFTGTDEFAPLPKPAEFSTLFSDSLALLSWNIKVQENVYVAYDIERSSDCGLSFQLRNSEPFVPILKDNQNAFAFYKDSTLANVELQYRIRGLNAFGEKGPYSTINKGKSQPSPQQAPKELKYEVIETRKIKLSWSYNSKELALIKGFKMYRSTEHEKGYQVISGALLVPKTQLSFVDIQPLGSAYYQAVAVDINGREHSSFPVMVQFEDAEPPKAPTGLKGTIDKQGKVTITWSGNKEKDLLGYYVYVSNGRKDEFSRVTPNPIKINTLVHKISLQTLTDSVYYEVLAMDKRFNESPRTLLALPRPDIIAPSPVSIIETKGTEKGIRIVWLNSASRDAKRYLVHRYTGPQGEEWKNDPEGNKVFASIVHKGDTTVYLDSTTLVGSIYQYGIEVEDKNGLLSPRMSYTTKERMSEKDFHAKVTEFTGVWHENKKKIVLNWMATGDPVKHWIIYRSSQGERLAQYESAKGVSFMDIQVEPKKTYNYMLRPVFHDRSMGGLSQSIKVQGLE